MTALQEHAAFPSVRPAPVREWTGRDAVALRKALRMTEVKFAAELPEEELLEMAETVIADLDTVIADLKKALGKTAGPQGGGTRDAG